MHSTRTAVPSPPPRPEHSAKAADAAVANWTRRYSPLTFAFFARIFERTLRGGTHRVRIAGVPDGDILQTPHLVIYTNHASWWDGIVFVFLAHRLLRGRRAFTPVDAVMMERYRFFSRIGGFGVSQENTRQGARDYRTHCKAVLADPANVLLIAAQDRFADPRERPLRLASGLSHLRDFAPRVTFLPLAIEYPFREERRPEVLMRFGQPLRGDRLASRGELAVRLEQGLATAMDQLAHDVVARNDSAYETVLSGSAGIDPIYDGWRRLRALLGGASFQPGHGRQP